MFEVDWTDYEKENVGQRKARKDVARELKKKEDAQSVRESISTRSSASSGEKPHGFFGTIGRRKNGKNKKPVASAVSVKNDGNPSRNIAVVPPAVIPPVSTLSSMSSVEPSAVFDERATELTTPTLASALGGSPADSMYSATRVIQPLGSSSFVTRTVETVYEPRRETDTDEAVTEIIIAADPPPPQTPTPPASPEHPASPGKDMSASQMINAWHAAVHCPSSSPTPLGHDEGRRGRVPMLSSQSMVTTPAHSPRQNPVVVMPPTWPARFRAHHPDAWRPPDAWNCPPAVDTAAAEAEELRLAAEREEPEADSISLDLAGMHREIMRMAVASPQIMLNRMNEAWGSATDARFYKEAEMEKKRWMLSAMYTMDKRPEISRSIVLGDQKVLALFETQATASYLAARYMGSKITHLAPCPLSHKLFPNVQPLFAPVNAALSLAPNSFAAVHCLTLPSLLSSHDIPHLLRSINRCLIPEGVLHLVLIDPMPAADRLGPRMREWLEDHLILNLEARFRLTKPSGVFPTWLSEAGLRGGASSLSKIKFQAIHRTCPADGSDASSSSPKNEEERVKKELRSTVGRMLWQEVWGPFVTGNNWWWEDEACIEECLRLGTCFEFHLIDAVKETVDDAPARIHWTQSAP
ncbi:hypothetical protein QBC46DRAFT_312766 [Diplogelasinospora grovesii]|uniref:Methyltransferase type 11 domain-containing protein n=1 Tax=Diplogelasinospora grovesii TaxID=303347 RepID=A0AAN6S4G9_9PEZI|nr:hypothetical protein QBC46DRAFT_312766 [Diplogelasinospora grovesii]